MSYSQLAVILTGFLAGFISIIIVVFLLKRYKKEEDGYDDIKNTSFVFSGNIKQTGLLDAVQLLELGAREGVLHVYSGRRKGYLSFYKGKVIDAFFRNLTGRKAVVEMFKIDDGDFYFEPKTVDQPRMIKDSIIDLAFELDKVDNKN